MPTRVGLSSYSQAKRRVKGGRRQVEALRTGAGSAVGERLTVPESSVATCMRLRATSPRRPVGNREAMPLTLIATGAPQPWNEYGHAATLLFVFAVINGIARGAYLRKLGEERLGIGDCTFRLSSHSR